MNAVAHLLHNRVPSEVHCYMLEPLHSYTVLFKIVFIVFHEVFEGTPPQELRNSFENGS